MNLCGGHVSFRYCNNALQIQKQKQTVSKCAARKWQSNLTFWTTTNAESQRIASSIKASTSLLCDLLQGIKLASDSILGAITAVIIADFWNGLSVLCWGCACEIEKQQK